MKLLEATEHDLIFAMSPNQRATFERVLREYPANTGQKTALSRTCEEDELTDAQEFLEEAMAERRTENQRNVRNFLREPGRFEELEDEIQLRLRRTRVNWLLEVLNEIRVGHWHEIGSPEIEETVLTPENVEVYISMQLCAEFQMVLLSALDGERE